jgi:hypothetical protein
MAIDCVGDLFIGFQPLPLERCPPVVEEAPRPGLVFVAPELIEGLLEQIGGVGTLVGPQQSPQRLTAFQGKVLPARQKGVFLALDEASVLSREARRLALAQLVERVAQAANGMELVEQDRGPWGVGAGNVAKRLPHFHHGEPDARPFPFANSFIKFGHAGFRPIGAA